MAPDPKKNSKTKKFIHKKRRDTNVTAMFDKEQIAEFREFFTMIDRKRTGVIEKEDLREMFRLVGLDRPEEVLDGMISDARGPLTFTVFLTMFAERMTSPIDSASDLHNALSSLSLDERSDVDSMDAQQMCDLLTTGGGLSEEDVHVVLSDLPLADGRVSFSSFTRLLNYKTAASEEGHKKDEPVK